MYFEGKVGIITGSSRGIGRVLAKMLVKKGAAIVINGRNKERLEQTRREFLEEGIEVLAIPADITSVSDCENLIKQTIDHYGKLDFLVNNGSLTMNESVDQMDVNTFSSVFTSNSLGAVIPTKIALPFIQKSKGSILFISSLAGLHSMPAASAYSMGKMSLTAFWQSMQIELSHTGVHCGICYLGFTENDADKKMLQANGKETEIPHRPKFLQQSQVKVARQIARMIEKRRKRKTFSTLGKIVQVVFRFFPGITLFIMTKSQKKNHANR